MAYKKLHNTDYVIQVKHGASANIADTATVNSAVEGEPAWTTDTKQLYMFDGTQFVKVLTCDSSGHVADGTYTVGLGLTTDGTITIQNGIITAIQEAT